MSDLVVTKSSEHPLGAYLVRDKETSETFAVSGLEMGDCLSLVSCSCSFTNCDHVDAVQSFVKQGWSPSSESDFPDNPA